MKSLFPIIIVLIIFAGCNDRVSECNSSFTYAFIKLIDWNESTDSMHTKIRNGPVRMTINVHNLADENAIINFLKLKFPNINQGTNDQSAYYNIESAGIDTDIIQFKIDSGDPLSGDLVEVFMRVLDGNWHVIHYKRMGIK